MQRTVVFGTQQQVDAALEESSVSNTINTSYVERYNGTVRCFNSRKVRKTYEFSKDIDLHEAATWLGVTVYNFCRSNRGLDIKLDDGRVLHRTPAMAAGLAKRPLSLTDVMHTQLFEFDLHREPKQ